MQTTTQIPYKTSSHLAPVSQTQDRRSSRLDEVFRLQGHSLSVPAQRTIVSHGQAIENRYQVIAGFVRCCTFTEDGYRQIFRFAGPGDMLGYVDLERWHYTAEAVDKVALRALPNQILEIGLAEDAALRREMRAICAEELACRERQLTWLSYLPSEERLMAFLSEIEGRLPAQQGFAKLPMSRQDIGDHLGMSLETVSRAFGTLKRGGRIAMNGCSRFRIAAGERAAQAA
ncbi:MAG: helix-turn-helix domain-containing protein [Rhodospirillales bacterium]